MNSVLSYQQGRAVEALDLLMHMQCQIGKERMKRVSGPRDSFKMEQKAVNEGQ